MVCLNQFGPKVHPRSEDFAQGLKDAEYFSYEGRGNKDRGFWYSESFIAYLGLCKYSNWHTLLPIA